MTPKQRRFAQEYLLDLNGTAAYRRAGYKARSDGAAAASASEILRNPKIQSYIQQLQAERSRRTEIEADRVLQEIAAIAFSDISDLLEWDSGGVHLQDSAELPDSARAAIANIFQHGTSIKVRLHSKIAALALLAKHVGLLGDFEGAIATLRLYGVHLRRDGARWVIDDAEVSSQSTNNG